MNNPYQAPDAPLVVEPEIVDVELAPAVAGFATGASLFRGFGALSVALGIVGCAASG